MIRCHYFTKRVENQNDQWRNPKMSPKLEKLNLTFYFQNIQRISTYIREKSHLVLLVIYS